MAKKCEFQGGAKLCNSALIKSILVAENYQLQGSLLIPLAFSAAIKILLVPSPLSSLAHFEAGHLAGIFQSLVHQKNHQRNPQNPKVLLCPKCLLWTPQEQKNKGVKLYANAGKIYRSIIPTAQRLIKTTLYSDGRILISTSEGFEKRSPLRVRTLGHPK